MEFPFCAQREQHRYPAITTVEPVIAFLVAARVSELPAVSIVIE
jgi:hypothetical protein